MKQSPRAARWDVHFRVAGSDATNKSTFSLHRDRQAGRAKVSWALSTQNARLPLSIAWSVCPSLRQLGEACEFSGRIRSIQQSPERRMTEIAGSISAIRLDQLSAPFSFRLSGLGRLFLSQAELVQTTGRATMLAAASGSFESSAGTIGRRILQSARDAFSLTMDSRFERQSLFGYRDLVLRFALGDGKLAVRGKKASGRGMDAWPILFDRKSGLAMLGGSTSELIPAIAISRFLAIPSEHKVSATREVYDFLRHLPTPRRRVPKSHLPRTSIRVQ